MLSVELKIVVETLACEKAQLSWVIFNQYLVKPINLSIGNETISGALLMSTEDMKDLRRILTQEVSLSIRSGHAQEN